MVRVLIVDDQSLVQTYLRTVVEENPDCSVVGTLDCADAAVARCAAGGVDLVLMDMKMPVMDGRTATSEIRKFNAEIPIIALTAHAFDADRVAALKAGCDDYLVKPINGAKLMQTLKEYGC